MKVSHAPEYTGGRITVVEKKVLLYQRACAKHKPCKCVRETIYRLVTLINRTSFLWL